MNDIHRELERKFAKSHKAFLSLASASLDRIPPPLTAIRVERQDLANGSKPKPVLQHELQHGFHLPSFFKGLCWCGKQVSIGEMHS